MLMSSMLLCLVAFSIHLEKSTINWEISNLLDRVLKPPSLTTRILQVYFSNWVLKCLSPNPKSRCLQDGSKLHSARNEKCKCQFAYVTVTAIKVEKNNLSSTGISHCVKINVWEQGQIEFKMILYKEIIHIFTFKVFESTRSGTDFLRPFLLQAISRKNSSSRFDAYFISKKYKTAAEHEQKVAVHFVHFF